MKTFLNKYIIFSILCFYLFGCNYEHTENEYLGLFICQYQFEDKSALHYLILNEDKTYLHRYILNQDTANNVGKWNFYISNYDKKWTFDIYDWKNFGAFVGECISDSCWLKQVRFSKKCIWFYLDWDYKFVKIDSLEAARLGIKEDGVQW